MDVTSKEARASSSVGGAGDQVKSSNVGLGIKSWLVTVFVAGLNEARMNDEGTEHPDK